MTIGGWIILVFLLLALWGWLAEERNKERKKAEIEVARQKIYALYEEDPKRINNPEFQKLFKTYWTWWQIRGEVLRYSPRICAACGCALSWRKRLHVDHIKPRSKYPELRYLKANLQILCISCNLAKSDYDGDDWLEVVAKRRKAFRKVRKVKTRNRNSE